jgi:hypothetical protein
MVGAQGPFTGIKREKIERKNSFKNKESTGL